ncbi:MAG: glycosyltransferase [Deltaproteobacteria bacterium]|nr:glycosyltransferase [Deltaproteobacteria bacterium]
MRVLILSTPFDARARLDGSRCAIADLVAGLVAEQVAEPTVLVTEGGEAPPGARAEHVGRAPLEALLGTLLAQVDVVHAWFAPRVVTATALRALRVARRLPFRSTSGGLPIVQTVASVPRSFAFASAALAGDVVVATSDATAIALATHGVDARKMVRVPSPFAPRVPDGTVAAPRDLLLYAGDWEFDDGIDRALHALSRLAPPRGVFPHLAIAARGKTDRAREVEARVRRKVEGGPLRDRVTILGEVPSLLPWIAASRAVLLPASTTYAKLDHPRALLEAIALGVPIIVGPAPSLTELCDDPRVGEVARDEAELRDAIEGALSRPRVPTDAISKVLSPRRPDVVARRYGELYARATGARSRV